MHDSQKQIMTGICHVAVLTPVYQDPDGLKRTMDSLKAQTIHDFDWIVVDDGSQPPIEMDNEDLPFNVRIIPLERNQGITAALNAGLEYILESGYDFVARLDAGDVALPDRFAKQLNFLRMHAEYGAVGSWVELVDPTGTTLLVPRDA